MDYKPTIKHRFEYIGLKFIIFLLKILPHRSALWLGGIIGKFLWILGIRRKVSRKNFELCFGEIYSKKESDKILSESYTDFCKSMVEFARLPKICNRTDELVHFENFEILQKLAEKKRGAILITGHFGSWELFAAALAKAGIAIDVVVGIQKNHIVDKFLVEYREKMGIGIIRVGVASRGILRSLKSNRMIAMLSDQDAGKSGIMVNFFGNRASTAAGAAVFALKTKCPVVAGYIARNPDGYTHTGYVRKLTIPEPTGDNEKDISRLTQFFTDIIQEGIEKYPSQYFWAHRRFKSTIKY
ncbi:lysophospholipid acyltransferase family protein [bacterium]|nr:lysophospholipid acyltransferase family protein [bacterium]